MPRARRYDTLGACGPPVDKVAQAHGAVYTRQYAKCTVTVNCTVTEACTAHIDGPRA